MPAPAAAEYVSAGMTEPLHSPAPMRYWPGTTRIKTSSEAKQMSPPGQGSESLQITLDPELSRSLAPSA
jgi:hypothetical protein